MTQKTEGKKTGGARPRNTYVRFGRGLTVGPVSAHDLEIAGAHVVTSSMHAWRASVRAAKVPEDLVEPGARLFKGIEELQIRGLGHPDVKAVWKALRAGEAEKVVGFQKEVDAALSKVKGRKE